MKSIRARLLVSLVLGLVAALALGGAGVQMVVRDALEAQLDSEVTARAEGLAAQVSFDDGVVEFEFAKGESADVIEEGFFEFRRLNGELLWRSDGLEGRELAVLEPGEGQPLLENVALPEGEPGRCAWMWFLPRVDPDKDAEEDEEEDADEEPQELPEGAVYLTEFEPLVVAVAIDRSPTDEAIAAVRNALLGVGGLVALFGGLLVFFGVRWGLRPLDQLAMQLHGVDEDTLSVPPDGSNAPAELAPVYRELSKMLRRIEATIERERSFTSAAAHELRTPLAEIRATAEVARKWPDDARGMAALDEILAVCEELERMVESLLHISRASNGTVGGRTNAVQLLSIVNACAERATEQVAARQLDVRVEVAGDAVIGAAPEAVEVIVRNLFDNAVRYSAEGGSVVVRTAAGNNGDCAVVVENRAAALREADLPHLFDAFWQADAARSDRRHVGLGLTVVRQVAKAAGLEVGATLEGDTLAVRLA